METYELADDLDKGSFEWCGASHLRCPSCKSDFLHHDYLKVYGDYSKTTASRHNVFLVSDQDDVAIGFYCEICDANIELVITQHKGSTGLTTAITKNGRMIDRLKR